MTDLNTLALPALGISGCDDTDVAVPNNDLPDLCPFSDFANMSSVIDIGDDNTIDRDDCSSWYGPVALPDTADAAVTRCGIDNMAMAYRDAFVIVRIPFQNMIRSPRIIFGGPLIARWKQKSR
jgi:hypothetical protein